MKNKNLMLIAVFVLVIVGCKNERNLNADITINIDRIDKYYEFRIDFNIQKNKLIYYDPNCFLPMFNYNIKEYDSLINSSQSILNIQALPNINRFIIENRNNQRKVLVLDYDIIKGKRLKLIEDNFFDTITRIKYPIQKIFQLNKGLVDLSELKINPNDTQMRLIYISHDNIGKHKKILFSNWIDLNKFKQ